MIWFFHDLGAKQRGKCTLMQTLRVWRAIAWSKEKPKGKNLEMAIYHLSVKTTSRSHGLSSVARASYRSGIAMTDNRTGDFYDYGKKKGVVHSEIFLGNGWEQEEREKLWNRIEQTEVRKNSTVCREFEFSLPEELDRENQISLARDFSLALVNRFQFAADLSIHIPDPESRKPDSDLDHDNAHCHLLTSTRTADGKKIRELDDKNSGAITEVRNLWENFCNRALKNAGLSVQVSAKKLPPLEERKESNGLALEKIDRQIRAVERAMDRVRSRAAQYASQGAGEGATPHDPARVGGIKPEAPDEASRADDRRDGREATDGSVLDALRPGQRDPGDDGSGQSPDCLDRRDARGEGGTESRLDGTGGTSDGTGMRHGRNFKDALGKLETKLRALQAERNILAMEEQRHGEANGVGKTGEPKGQTAPKAGGPKGRSKTHSQGRIGLGKKNQNGPTGGPGPAM